VTLNGASSVERVLANPMTPERTVLDRIRPSMGCFTEMDVMLMIRPQRFSFITGTTSRVMTMVLRRFRRNPLLHMVSSISRKFIDGGPPALLTRISTVPKWARALRTNWVAWRGSDTSAATANTSAPVSP